MMPHCSVAGGSRDSEAPGVSSDSADGWVSVCDLTPLVHTGDGTSSCHPEERSEVTEGGAGSDESRHIQDAESSLSQQSPERGEDRHAESKDDVPSTGDDPQIGPPHPPDSPQGQRQIRTPHPPDSPQGQRRIRTPHPPDSPQGQRRIRTPHPPDSPHGQRRIRTPHPPDSPQGHVCCACSQISSQAQDPQKPSCHLSSPLPQVSPCSTQTAVVTPQPGVGQQIVLNIRDLGDGLTLDGVPLEAVSQGHDGCHVSQRVAKQIVLIFVNQPCDSVKQTCSRSCGGPTSTVNASTQTSMDMCHRTLSHSHSDRPPPSKSPYMLIRSQSCGTQTEWGKKHETSEYSPVHANIAPMSHLVSQRTSCSTRTECPYRVLEHPSPSCNAQTLSREVGAPDPAFIQGMRTPSSVPDAACESHLSPADTHMSSQADRTKKSENLCSPPSVLETHNSLDDCQDYDHSQHSSCQTHGSSDRIGLSSVTLTPNQPSPRKETQRSSGEPRETTTSKGQIAGKQGDRKQHPLSEEPMETSNSDGQTAGKHGDQNQYPLSEEPMETSNSVGQTAGKQGDRKQHPLSEEPMETTISDGQTAEKHGDQNQHPLSEESMEKPTSDAQTAEKHGDQNQHSLSEEPMEKPTSDAQTAEKHGDQNQHPLSEEPMEKPTSDAQTAEKHGDQNQHPLSEEPMEKPTSDAQTAEKHGDQNQHPLSEEPMEKPTSDAQTAEKHGDQNQHSLSEETMEKPTSDGQTAEKHGDQNQHPLSEEPRETNISDGQTAEKHGDQTQHPLSEEPMEKPTSNAQTAEKHGDQNQHPLSKEPRETNISDGETAEKHGDQTQHPLSEKPMEKPTSNAQTAEKHGDQNQHPLSEEPRETNISDGETAEKHGDQTQHPLSEGPMEKITSDCQTAEKHGDQNRHPLSEEPMEKPTSDGQTAEKHGDQNQHLLSEEPMEKPSSDAQTAEKHGDQNQHPLSEEPMEKPSSDAQTAEKHGDQNQHPLSEEPMETATSDGQTAGKQGDQKQHPLIEEPMETATSDGQTAGKQGDQKQHPLSEEPMETTTSDGQTAEKHGDQNQHPLSEEPMEKPTSDGQTAGSHGDLNLKLSDKPMETTTTSNAWTTGIHGDMDHQPSTEESTETTTSDGQTAGVHGDLDHLLDKSPHIPCQSSDQSKEASCVPGPQEGKREVTNNPALKNLNRCDTEPERPSCSSPSNHIQMPCGTSCLPPSLHQYLDSLLEQHRMSLDDPVNHQNSQSSSSSGPCDPPQPHVRQIILNILEKQSMPVSADVSSPSIPSRASSWVAVSEGIGTFLSPGTAAEEQSSLMSKSESQDVPSLGASLTTSMPGHQNVLKPGSYADTLSSVGGQEVPKPSNRSDVSPSDPLTSKPLSQDVSSQGTAYDALSILVTSMAVNQDIPGAATDAYSSLRKDKPRYQDVPEPGSTDNLLSPSLNRAASQDVLRTSDLCLPELVHQSENHDVAAPATCSMSSSSALMNDRPVHQDVPGPRDSPSAEVLASKPERQDFFTASDSMTVTQDVSSPGTASNVSDTSSVLTSRPVNQDIPGAEPTGDSITSLPLTQDVSEPDTVTDTVSSHNMPVSEDVSEPGTLSSIRSHLERTQICDETLAEMMKDSIDEPESRPCQPQRPPKSHSCPALVLEAVTSSGTQEVALPADEELVGPLRRASRVENEVTFDDIAVYFSREEWEVLKGPQKGLYCQVMMDNYRSLSSLGVLLDKPGLISRIEDKEAELWEDRGALSRFSLQGGDQPPFPALCTTDVQPLVEDEETPENVGGESAKSSSHLGALMRLVNEIPGFLLGGSSPGQNLEDAENIRPEVKAEKSSPSGTPASVHTQRIGETPESSSPGAPWGAEKSNLPAKAEEVEIPIHPSYRHNQPARHPRPPPERIKSEPGACTGGSPPRELQIKQEELPVTCSPAGGAPGKLSDVSSMKIRSPLIYKHPASWQCHPADGGRYGGSGDGENTWTFLPPSLSAGTVPRNTSVSPASLSDGSSTAALRDLHIKIKQEDSGSERDPAESPIRGRKILSSPMAPSPSVLEQFRLGASPRRSTMDTKSPHPQDVPHGKSHLHGLVNCLKEISASRSWTQPSAPNSGRCVGETERSSADPSLVVKTAALDSSSPSRMVGVLWRPPDGILKDEHYSATSRSPNPFTVAVTNGSARLKGAEAKMAESYRPRAAEPPAGSPLTCGKYPDRVHTRQNTGSSGFQKTEEQRRVELGVKRTYSEDSSRSSSGASAAKRPNMGSCSPSRVMGTLWIPPDDGKCPLMSVRNCVRKIPSCWAPPPLVRGPSAGSSIPEPCHVRTGTQGGGMLGKMVEVKEEKTPSPIPTPTRLWVPPPGSPRSPDQSGTPSTNVHLSGLMRLMEEIPVAESSSSSRTMYNIAIGHSMMRRPDRANFLSYYNDDGSFQAELNDSTVASVDSVYSDDTSLSSDNLDPSYSAIGGLQRVVSEFAELGSVSPLVAVSVPPSAGTQEGHKTREPALASTPRLNDSMRGSQRGTPVSSASVCSAEDGEAAYAALCGLQKVVHGFNEQQCVSPFSAVRSTPNHGGLRESLPKKSFNQEEEEESPQLPDSLLGHRFLCEGPWLSKADSSYSALSGLQKVVNGFSDLGCVSPFSAVSTSASESAIEICSRKKSEQPAIDVSCSALCGLKKVVNGVPESCASPATPSSNPSSVGESDPTVRRRCEQSEVHSESGRSHGSSYTSHKNPPRPSGQCIDLTQEEEPTGAKARTPNQDKQSIRNDPPGGRTPESSSGQAVKPVGGRVRPPTSSQLIDLTEEEETPARHKAPSSDAVRKPHSVSPSTASPHKAASERKHRAAITRGWTQRVSANRPLDPGPSGPHRAGIPSVNEHISGLEKLLKGVPTFTPPNTPSGQRRSGSWWFKSTSPHET